MSDLANFMAGMRKVESGDMGGDYQHRQNPEGGLRPVGAYGFTNWPQQAAAAGLPEANMGDHRAQDTVAGTLFRNLFQKYQNWELVALAWFTNEKTADEVAQGGYGNLNQIGNPRIKEYMQSVTNAVAEAEASETTFTAPVTDVAGPPSQPIERGTPPRQFRASELMSVFVDELSSQVAGGQRTSIDELAPKVIPTDPAALPGLPAEDDNSEEVTPV